MINRLFRITPKLDNPPIPNPTCYTLVMYSRTTGCPFISVAKRVLSQKGVAYREIMIDQDPQARERVKAWTGFLSVPTLVIAEQNSDLPYEDVLALEGGQSPRGVNRGAMLTEPSADQLETWLHEHRFI